MGSSLFQHLRPGRSPPRRGFFVAAQKGAGSKAPKRPYCRRERWATPGETFRTIFLGYVGFQTELIAAMSVRLRQFW